MSSRTILWETMTCCSACSHDTSFVVRAASENVLVCGFRNVLWIRAYALASGVFLYFSGKDFECGNAREFRNRVSPRESCEKSGTL